MKTGLTLPQLAAQIKAEMPMKRDFVAPTDKLTYVPEGDRGKIMFGVNDSARFSVEPTPHCLKQICQFAGIPSKYVDEMLVVGKDGNRPHLKLLADNINWWFSKTPAQRMLRTIQNGEMTARAFLSNSYRPRDNYDLAEKVIPVMLKAGCEVRSAQITETRLYIQASTPKMEIDVKELMRARGITDIHPANRNDWPNDPVRASVVISNSEVGAGSIRIEPGLDRLRCYNMLIASESLRKIHIGKRVDFGDEAAELFSNETRKLDDEAFWAKVTDLVTAVFDQGKFASLVEKFAQTGAVMLAHPADTVQEIGKRFQLTEGETKSVLDHLIAGGDNTVYGLTNAITRAATDVESYDRSIELQRIGGEIIELPQGDWKKLD